MEHPIYLDYNATTPIDPEVANEMMPYLTTHYGNPSSSYSLGRSNQETINRSRKKVADLINAKPEEIIFTSSATESNNLAIHGIALANLQKGKHIITSSVEHPSVLEVCNYLSSLGWDITYLPVDRYGRVSPRDVENAIKKDTVLITIMHANNEVGTIQPVTEISAIAKRRNIVFHTDASQSVGKIEADVIKMRVDLLTLAGHKLYAPKGIGALYIKQGTRLANILHGAGQERGIRPGTENVLHIAGLGKACEIAKRDFFKNQLNMQAMRDRLFNGLESQLGDAVKAHVGLENCLPNTLSIAIDQVDAHKLVSDLSISLFISTGSACHSGAVQISSVLKAMKIPFVSAASTIRISTGKNTTAEEIDLATEVLVKAINKLKIKQ